MQFESHRGHSVPAGQRPVGRSSVYKITKGVYTNVPFFYGQHLYTHQKDGSTSSMVRWRDPKRRSNQGLTVSTLLESETVKRPLDANGQSFEIAQHAILSNEKRTPTVAEVIQEYIDLLIRPSSGTTKTYQTMLDLHIRNVIGHVPVDKLDYRLIAHWVKSMMAKGKAPKTIHNVHGLISAAMNTAEMLGYITRDPCRGVQLPGIEKAEDEAIFSPMPSSASSWKGWGSGTRRSRISSS
jgi:hypothetical protein